VQQERYEFCSHKTCLSYTLQVLEETGYNIANQLEPENYIKFIMKDEQQVTLFVVFGVAEDYPFKTKTRKEISVCVISHLLGLSHL
jgi:hypothetical protein